jgi:hypothetical protein
VFVVQSCLCYTRVISREKFPALVTRYTTFFYPALSLHSWLSMQHLSEWTQCCHHESRFYV